MNSPISVTIRDTQTGEEKTTDAIYSEFWWVEGNGSCDCNRMIPFLPEEIICSANFCLGCKRFLLVAVNGNRAIDMQHWNEGYPASLWE